MTAVFVLLNMVLFLPMAISGEDYPVVAGYGWGYVSSGSMEPALSEMDLVITKAQDAYETGDIVVYRSSDADKGTDGTAAPIVHRIVSVSGSTFTAKGDANTKNDAPAKTSDIFGKVVCVIRGAGAVIVLLQEPYIWLAVVSFLMILQTYAYVTDTRADRKTIAKGEGGCRAKEGGTAVPESNEHIQQ